MDTNVESPSLGRGLSSNNPYRQQRLSQSNSNEAQLASAQLRYLDSEKYVMAGEPLSGPDNAPMVVDQEVPKPQPEREADKEVASSWQTQSREENAPIAMEYHETHSSDGNLMNDYKGAPPSYESLNRQSRSESDDGHDLVTTPMAIEPDGAQSTYSPRPEDRSAVGQLLAWMPPAPRLRPEQMPRLIQPVVIPQLDVPPQGESVPFTRCYSDVLISRDVSMRGFTAFLDGLALAQSPNSALQSLKMFGAGVSFVHLPIIPLAGKGIAALASSGSGHSGSRARLYIDRVKKEYFEPRGLRLSILKDTDLNSRLQLPTHASKLAPLTKNTLSDNLCKRRFEGVAPYVGPLRYDVPEQDKQIQGVHKLARKHLEHKFKNGTKSLTRLREEQWRYISTSGPDLANWDERYAAKMVALRKTQLQISQAQSRTKTADEKSPELKELLDALQQDQRGLQLMISERQMAMQNNQRYGRSGVEAEIEEEKWSRRLKWIVIEDMQ